MTPDHKLVEQFIEKHSPCPVCYGTGKCPCSECAGKTCADCKGSGVEKSEALAAAKRLQEREELVREWAEREVGMHRFVNDLLAILNAETGKEKETTC